MSEALVQRRRSVCPHDCPSVCSLDVEVIDSHTIGRVYGNKAHSYTDGVICAKVSRYAERVHHADRLLRPLLRRGGKAAGTPSFEPVSWDDALDMVAERWQRIIESHGAQAIWPYHYAGTMGLVQRDGLDRLRNTLGTSQQHSTFCVTLADAGWQAGVGAKRGVDAREMADSELIVVWGGNPVNTQVNVMHYIAKARKARQAELVVVDPYKTRTADKADQHLMLKPGTDGALACAVMHVLLKEDLVDREYLATYTDFNSDVEQHLDTRGPAWASEITGLSTEEIVQFAERYGRSKRSYIRAGYGFTRSRNGAANMHAVSCLPAMTGAWQYKGGGALYSQGAIYPMDKTLISGTDAVAAHTRVFDQSRIGEVLCGNPDDLAGGPPIHALFVQNTNPAVVAPDTNRVLEGLRRDDLFTVVHEQFMTETAEFADLVLPATMFLEHDDLYVAGGHTTLQVARQLIQPPTECRSNHWVLSQLAKRLGLEHEGFHLSEWDLIEATLSASGLPSADTIADAGEFDCAPAPDSSRFLDGFDTPDKRFHFSPDWSRVGPDSAGMPSMPDHWPVIDERSEALPLRLVAAPARQFLNTSFTETASARRMEKEPHACLHPSDLCRYSLLDGELIALSNERGEVRLKAKAFDGVQPGTVIVEGIWPNKSFVGGVGINALTAAVRTQPNGGAPFHDTAVRATAVSLSD